MFYAELLQGIYPQPTIEPTLSPASKWGHIADTPLSGGWCSHINLEVWDATPVLPKCGNF